MATATNGNEMKRTKVPRYSRTSLPYSMRLCLFKSPKTISVSKTNKRILRLRSLLCIHIRSDLSYKYVKRDLHSEYPIFSIRFDSLRGLCLIYIFINEHRECVRCALSRSLSHTHSLFFLIDNQSSIQFYYGVYGRLWLNRHFPLPSRNTDMFEATLCICIYFLYIHSFSFSSMRLYKQRPMCECVNVEK